jgi:predicted HicB family RNase H-like nuclease
MSSFMHYRDYIGSVEFSEEDQCFHGKLVGIRDSITFEGDCVTSLTADFHNAVDEYLEFCERKGKQPEKPFKGSFNVRIQPELHRKAALVASTKGLSLNAFVEEAIRRSVS